MLKHRLFIIISLLLVNTISFSYGKFSKNSDWKITQYPNYVKPDSDIDALMRAALQGKKDIVIEILANSSLNINVKDKNGKTALDYAFEGLELTYLDLCKAYNKNNPFDKIYLGLKQLVFDYLDLIELLINNNCKI